MVRWQSRKLSSMLLAKLKTGSPVFPEPPVFGGAQTRSINGAKLFSRVGKAPVHILEAVCSLTHRLT